MIIVVPNEFNDKVGFNKVFTTLDFTNHTVNDPCTINIEINSLCIE